MSRASLINLSLQVGFAILRYAMMGWVYAQSDLEGVGQINTLLTYVTAITFVAGFELHHVVNRPLVLGHSRELRWGLDRVLLAAITIGLMAWIAGSLLFMTQQYVEFALLVFMAATAEYLALEVGRILIIRGQYLVVTVCGFIRSVSPFLIVALKGPHLESMLWSWLLGTTLVLALQVWLLRSSDYFVVTHRRLDRTVYRSAAHFFAAGVSMTLMPLLERWLVKTSYSGIELGQYALGITLVSVCELVMQGGIWQPFITRILRRLAQPVLKRSAVVALLGATAVVYISAGVLALLLSSHLLDWINKEPLPQSMLLGVFAMGLAKALYSLLFYCHYATGREQALPKIQLAMVAVLVLAFTLDVYVNIGAGMVFLVTGAVWIGLLLVLIWRWAAAGDPAVAS
jgi:hypothetical protein